MRIFWWQGGLHLEPESDSDREALRSLHDTLVAWTLVPLTVGWPDVSRADATPEGHSPSPSTS
jgi:hypothetical protein